MSEGRRQRRNVSALLYTSKFSFFKGPQNLYLIFASQLCLSETMYLRKMMVSGCLYETSRLS